MSARDRRSFDPRHLLVALVLLVSGFNVDAQTAWFADGRLVVPEVLVGADEPRLHEDVEFVLRGDGSLAFAGAREGAALADVQSASVTLIYYKPAPVMIVLGGFKSVQCAQLARPRVSRTDYRFVIVLEERPLPDNIRCQGGRYPFDLMVPIATESLDPGEYDVFIHGLTLHFQVLTPP